MADAPMGRAELLDYAEECGLEAAYGMVLLLGPDNIDGGWDAYRALLEMFRVGE